ncbi:hypothetical protein [Corynebacterium argentoratense]|uniref:hypothetical protein n=1 Tax=Corynebacterium argentoratense TaxID=42817 RepID=UPI001F229E57|nr:hypothetical protein [Corynebacterium argentoratense]MCF1764664.1 hypothetical protein [Corynebacterium argentoratense]
MHLRPSDVKNRRGDRIKKGLSATVMADIDRPLPTTLAKLATIRINMPDSISVLIDTKKLVWDEFTEVTRDVQTAYDGSDYYAAYTDADVWWVEDRPVTRLPMLTEDQDHVWLWMMELPLESKSRTVRGLLHRKKDKTDMLNTKDLLVLATEAMGTALDSEKHQGRPSASTKEIYFPALEAHYEAKTGDLHCYHPERGYPYGVAQRFAVAVNEQGARAIVETLVTELTGLPPDFEELPKPVIFGENGPVMYWFGSDDSPLPFCILHTTSEAWADPDDEIDLDELKLEPWTIP